MHKRHVAGLATALLLGNYQARPFDPPPPIEETWSRAVEYAIDEERRTVREVWQSEAFGPDRVIAVAMGGADWLPGTGNVPVAYGALVDPDSLGQIDWPPSSRLRFNQWTRLREREYRRTDPPEVVYGVVLETGRTDLGWTPFGAGRIDRLGRHPIPMAIGPANEPVAERVRGTPTTVAGGVER